MSKQSDADNRSNQLNPNNDAYYQSRGYDGRPDSFDDEDSDGGGYFCSAAPASSPYKSDAQIRLEIEQKQAREQAAAIRERHLGLQLHDRLVGKFPNVVFHEKCWTTAVILQVEGVDAGSELAAEIRRDADDWLANFPGKDLLTVFKFVFISPPG